MSSSQLGLNKTVIVTSVILGLAFITSVGMGVWGYVETKTSAQNVIEITGKAERSIVSDQAKWTVGLATSGKTSDEAKKTLEELKEILKKSVADAGITDAEYSFQALQAYDNSYYEDVNSYGSGRASQNVVITSSNVGAIGELNQNFGGRNLLNNANAYSQGIEFSYSKRNQLEQELTEEAVANARIQAQKLIGKDLGKVIRINQAFMTLGADNSDYGYQDDRYSVDKKAVLSLIVTFTTK